jgi:hypothetical protein
MAKGDLRFNNHENFVFAYYYEKNPFMKITTLIECTQIEHMKFISTRKEKNYGKTKFNKNEKLKMVTRLEVGGMVKKRETSSNKPFCITCQN